jgi:hypothetical protein
MQQQHKKVLHNKSGTFYSTSSHVLDKGLHYYRYSI